MGKTMAPPVPRPGAASCWSSVEMKASVTSPPHEVQLSVGGVLAAKNASEKRCNQMFQGCFKDVLRCFKDVSRCFKNVLRMFKEDSRVEIGRIGCDHQQTQLVEF